METEQLTLNFSAGLSNIYTTCREVIHARIWQQGKQLKGVAAEMDLSPSHLNRKLTQSPNDTMRFTLDDLDAYLESTGDLAPLEYYIDKYYRKAKKDEISELKARIEQLQQQNKNS